MGTYGDMKYELPLCLNTMWMSHPSRGACPTVGQGTGCGEGCVHTCFSLHNGEACQTYHPNWLTVQDEIKTSLCFSGRIWGLPFFWTTLLSAKKFLLQNVGSSIAPFIWIKNQAFYSKSYWRENLQSLVPIHPSELQELQQKGGRLKKRTQPGLLPFWLQSRPMVMQACLRPSFSGLSFSTNRILPKALIRANPSLLFALVCHARCSEASALRPSSLEKKQVQGATLIICAKIS